jgi:5-formyltetrahydrofolate cyclo-ligase
MNTTSDKRQFRMQFEEYAAGMTAVERKAADRVIARRMCALILKLKPKTVFCYVSVGGETDSLTILRYLLNNGIATAVPRCRAHGIMEARIIGSLEELVPDGRFGIPEPTASALLIEPAEVDFTVVPGAGFGEDGSRLGRGGGYYDRWLSGYGGIKCGICREGFLVPSIPSEPHDIKMDLIMTERRFITVTPSVISPTAGRFGGIHG